MLMLTIIRLNILMLPPTVLLQIPNIQDIRASGIIVHATLRIRFAAISISISQFGEVLFCFVSTLASCNSCYQDLPLFFNNSNQIKLDRTVAKSYCFSFFSSNNLNQKNSSNSSDSSNSSK